MRLRCSCNSKRWKFAIVALTVFGSLLEGSRTKAQSPDTDRWSMLYAANTLDIEGSKPFHLKMTFQLYSLTGSAAETGTIEQWWYSPKDNHTVIRSPSLNSGSDTRSEFDEKTARESYLVNELLYFALRPIPKHDPSRSADVSEEARNFGKTMLDCLEAKSAGPPGMSRTFPTICTQQKSDAVRVVISPEGGSTSTRNSMGKFRDISVALDLAISMLDRDAITGKVITLESLPPRPVQPEADITAVTGTPVTANTTQTGMSAPASPATARIAGGVIAGFRTKFVQPSYPLLAKLEHMSGSVVFHAVISKDGNIEHLVPIASTDPIFTDAAMGAVKQWIYKPYLLNGEPTEVDTNITVNFKLRG
jgi:TonB family protein